MAEPWWIVDLDKPWEVNMAAMIANGNDPDKARTVTILSWMWHGDLRPLADAILQGQPLDQGVLNLLARMILDDHAVPCRVETKQVRRKGRPRDMGKFAREHIAEATYRKNVERGKSEAAFEQVANFMGRGTSAARRAITTRRKHKPTA
jgi:hypothetical protein